MTRLRELREQKGDTQQKIADLLGVTRAAYSNIENEKRQLGYAQLILLAQYYTVTVDHLLGLYAPDKSQSSVKLNHQESALLNAYRELSPEGRFEVDKFMDYAAERYKKDYPVPDVAND